MMGVFLPACRVSQSQYDYREKQLNQLNGVTGNRVQEVLLLIQRDSLQNVVVMSEQAWV
jgi:hypothetical protein